MVKIRNETKKPVPLLKRLTLQSLAITVKMPDRTTGDMGDPYPRRRLAPPRAKDFAMLAPGKTTGLFRFPLRQRSLPGLWTERANQLSRAMQMDQAGKHRLTFSYVDRFG